MLSTFHITKGLVCSVELIRFYCSSTRGSPNIEMDEETFLVNRERAVDYLNSLEKVF
jgi:hypothetical protein